MYSILFNLHTANKGTYFFLNLSDSQNRYKLAIYYIYFIFGNSYTHLYSVNT